jgi:hypothetical protein
MMCTCGQVMEKNCENFFFASLKSMKKGVGSGSESIGQRYGSGDPEPDPHQNVTDPQHCSELKGMSRDWNNRAQGQTRCGSETEWLIFAAGTAEYLVCLP